MSTKTREKLLEQIEQLLDDNHIVTVTINQKTDETVESQIRLAFRIIHESPQLDDAIQDLLEKTNQSGIEDAIITYDSKNACLEVRMKYDFELVQRYFEPYPVRMM